MTFQRTGLSRMVETEARFRKLKACVGFEAVITDQSKAFGKEGKAGDIRIDTGSNNTNEGKVLFSFTHFLK